MIVFPHGLGSSWRSYSYLGQGWSARGTASLHIQHVGSDETLWQGNPLMLLDRLLQRDSPFHAAIDCQTASEQDP